MLNYILYRIGEFLILSLPLKLGYSIAIAASFIKYCFSKSERALVSGNLRAIFPSSDKKTIRRYTRNAFINFGKYLTDFLSFQKLDRKFVDENIKIEGLENIDNALSKGKGLIIASAHLGSWELGGAGLGILGYKVSGVALTHKHKKIDDFFNRQRESKGLMVIPLGRAVKSCVEALSRNEIICLVGDKDFTGNGVTVDFFGRPTNIPKGPAAFALKYGAAIVFGATIRVRGDKFLLKFNKPIEVTPTGNYEEDVKSLTGIYLRQQEECIRKYPDQWFCFRRFWI